MAKFNEEIFDLNKLGEKDLAYIGVCLEALLTKEELDKLKQDWNNIGGFKTISLWRFALNNIDVSYKRNDKLLNYLEEKRRMGIAMNRTSLHPCEGFQPAVLIDEIEEFIKKD